MHLQVTWQAGTPTAVTATMSIPNNTAWSIGDVSTGTVTQVFGNFLSELVSSTQFSYAPIGFSTETVISFGEQSSGTFAGTKATGSALSAGSGRHSVYAVVPIDEWSSFR